MSLPTKALLRRKDVLKYLGIKKHELNVLIESKLIHPITMRPGGYRFFLTHELAQFQRDT